MATILVTGSSRGIGLELVRQLLDLPNEKVAKVFAVTRSSYSTGLQELLDVYPDRVSNVVIKDLSHQTYVENAAKEVQVSLNGRGLDILVNNAGTAIEHSDGIDTMSNQDMREVFNANVVSAQMMTAAFIPLLRLGREKKVVNVSSALGSIAAHQGYKWAKTYSYKISKAAMNMLTVQYAMEFENEGFTFFALSPGWIKTEMGSQQADLDLETGVGAIKDVALNPDRAKSGRFVNIHVPGIENPPGPNRYDGFDLPW